MSIKNEKILKLKKLIEDGMRAVHIKLLEDKIKFNEPLVISRNGKVVVVDAKTLKEK